VRIVANSPILGTLHLRYRAANVALFQLDAIAVEARDFLLAPAGFEVAGVERRRGSGDAGAAAGDFLGDVAQSFPGYSLRNWGGECDSHEAV